MPDGEHEETTTPYGRIAWHDLTVPDAEAVRDFYQAVVGWKSDAVSMGDYDDFTMIAPVRSANTDASASSGGGGEAVAGICHARGANADLPAQWLLYVTVADVGQSAQACVSRGGTLLTPIKAIGDAHFCVIRDPAGAVCALYGPYLRDAHNGS